ncbi:transposase [Photobacterium damselae]|uniref:transposase n=1 Tax=Photobacterium damselae TaxID=38293 RepID=UPI003D7E0FCE
MFSSKKFATAKQAAAFIGLIPQLNESGKLKGRTTMSKNGPSRVRAKLFLAAISASTHNPDIREQKRRLLAAGKTQMQALGAAMRKLIQICFGAAENTNKIPAPSELKLGLRTRKRDGIYKPTHPS